MTHPPVLTPCYSFAGDLLGSKWHIYNYDVYYHGDSSGICGYGVLGAPGRRASGRLHIVLYRTALLALR